MCFLMKVIALVLLTLQVLAYRNPYLSNSTLNLSSNTQAYILPCICCDSLWGP